MFLYKENNDKVIRRRGFGDSRELEGYNRGSAQEQHSSKGYVQTTTSSNSNKIKQNL